MAAIQLTLGQQTVVKRFGLEVTRDDKGNYRVEDRFIAQFYIGGNDPSKSGIYTNRKLDDAIQAAVAFRKAHDAEMTRRSGFSTDPVTVTPMRPRAKRVAAATAPVQVVTTPAPVVHKPRVLPDLSDEVDAEDDEFDDVELDNTGQRLSKRREPPRYSKSESSFLRGARVLVKRPNIGQEALAKDAVLALATAKYVRVAWEDILTTLDAAGYLNAAGKRLVPPAKPKKAGRAA
jgi:hypothetical protein